jgi:outer membrane protein assembly factor BamB
MPWSRLAARARSPPAAGSLARVKRALIVVAVLVVAALGAGTAYVWHLKQASQDVRGSSTEEFVTALAPTVEQPGEKVEADVPWPTYGFDAARVRTPPFALKPPYRGIWRFGARNLVEFPPAVGHRRLYFANNSGVFFAINARTGKRAWKRLTGRCVAASPAISGQIVYMTFLNRPPCNRKQVKGLTGEVVAFYAGSGKVRWRTEIGPTESSPLVAYERVYVGDWRGYVYALHARTGKVDWKFKTGGRIKGAVTLAGGRVFVGSYDHHLYALDARTGRLAWRGAAQERIGKRGTFYSTPAVAYGRVYVGATDGKVYSFGAGSGKLRWSHGTGGYVYSSPAVWKQRVYVGSYSKWLYCFDAATGDVKWRFRANGEISGSPTVLAGLVYFSTLERRTYALDARTGRVAWTFPDGKYTPVAADRSRLYLVGYARIYGLVPRSAKPAPAPKRKPPKRAKARG